MMKKCKCGKIINSKKKYCNNGCYVKYRINIGSGRRKYIRSKKCQCGCGLVVPGLKQLYFNRQHMCEFRKSVTEETKQKAKEKKEKGNKFLDLLHANRKNSVAVIDKAFRGNPKAIEALLAIQVTKLIRHGEELNLIMGGGK